MKKDEKPDTPLIAGLPEVRGSYRENASLARVNWFNIGGPAQILFRPADAEDLCHFLKNKPRDIPVTIIGVGSNLLVRDGGIDGVVIRLGRGFAGIKCEGEYVIAGAAALDYNVSMLAAEHSIAGLEFLSGIPGTIGGALAMNAGAYNSDISQVLEYAEAVDSFGQLHKLSLADIGFIYRGNTLPEGIVFTSACLRGKKDDSEQIKAKIAQIRQQREETQPVRSRTGGSTFRNPAGYKAWELIDKAGCRGMRYGEAQVSEKHCNFFINTGNATAADVEILGEKVRQMVKEKTGIDLEWEIRIIGKDAAVL